MYCGTESAFVVQISMNYHRKSLHYRFAVIYWWI